MECLPSDVVLEILSRLPVESVLDCKLVCKRLLNLLGHRWDQFAKMHHQQQLLQLASYGGDASSPLTGLLFSFQDSYLKRTTGPKLYYGEKYNNEMNIHENFSYKTLRETSRSYPHIFCKDVIVGSCNGLICLINYHHRIPDPIHICNPNTGEYVNLPEYIYNMSEEGCYTAAYGFGYVHSMTNIQYKVVRIYYPEVYGMGEVQVYTIGSGRGWRTIDEISYYFSFNPVGVLVNGDLHWIDDKTKKTVAFNLTDEEFRLIQSIPCDDPPYSKLYILPALKGNLCVCHQRTKERLLDIWSLKKNATEASWSRNISVEYDSTLGILYDARPLLITKKDEVVFVGIGSVLYCYDPKTTTVKKLWDDEKWEITGITASPHMNSFVSLKALGERSEMKKKLRHRSLEDTD